MNKLIFTIILVLFFLGCTNRTENYEETNFKISESNRVLSSSKAIYATFPTPAQIVQSISEAQLKFNRQILNPVTNVPYYETSKSLALNIGVYCADLSYAGFYEQNHLVLSYLSAIKTLSDNLGVLQAIDKEDILKLEDNIANQDTLKILIDDIFLGTGKYLNENNQPEMAILIQVGAWIEGMYIAMQMATQSLKINKDLVDRVVAQRESIDLIVDALSDYSNSSIIRDVHKDMVNLQRIYKKTRVYSNTRLSEIKMGKKNDNHVYITPEIFINLYQEITKIRNSYTQ